MEKVVLVMGAGDAIGSAIMQAFADVGYTVCGARRNGEKLDALVTRLNREGKKAHGFSCDARNEGDVTELFAKIEKDIGPLDCVIFNIGANVPMTILDTDIRKFTKIWEMAALSGFLTGQAAARVMTQRGHGSIIFTGATASMRGAAGYGAFASAKGALRNMVQSFAREMGPQNIHVAHVVIDAAVDTDWIRGMLPDYAERKANDGIVNPDELAQNYVWLHEQPRSSWTFEMDIRPWNEKW